MEAAAVAKGAEARGLPFAAVKVISDELAFPMPPMERFVAGDGSFQSGKLCPVFGHTALDLADGISPGAEQFSGFAQFVRETRVDDREFRGSEGRLSQMMGRYNWLPDVSRDSGE